MPFFIPHVLTGDVENITTVIIYLNLVTIVPCLLFIIDKVTGIKHAQNKATKYIESAVCTMKLRMSCTLYVSFL